MYNTDFGRAQYNISPVKIDQTQQSQYSTVSYKDFSREYSGSGFVKRKLLALPSAFIALILKPLEHLFKGTSDRRQLKAIKWDVEEGMGHVVTLFWDRMGSYKREKAQFEKECLTRSANYREEVAIEVSGEKEIKEMVDSLPRPAKSDLMGDIEENRVHFAQYSPEKINQAILGENEIDTNILRLLSNKQIGGLKFTLHSGVERLAKHFNDKVFFIDPEQLSQLFNAGIMDPENPEIVRQMSLEQVAKIDIHSLSSSPSNVFKASESLSRFAGFIQALFKANGEDIEKTKQDVAQLKRESLRQYIEKRELCTFKYMPSDLFEDFDWTADKQALLQSLPLGIANEIEACQQRLASFNQKGIRDFIIKRPQEAKKLIAHIPEATVKSITSEELTCHFLLEVLPHDINKGLSADQNSQVVSVLSLFNPQELIKAINNHPENYGKIYQFLTESALSLLHSNALIEFFKVVNLEESNFVSTRAQVIRQIISYLNSEELMKIIHDNPSNYSYLFPFLNENHLLLLKCSALEEYCDYVSEGILQESAGKLNADELVRLIEAGSTRLDPVLPFIPEKVAFRLKSHILSRDFLQKYLSIDFSNNPQRDDLARLELLNIEELCKALESMPIKYKEILPFIPTKVMQGFKSSQLTEKLVMYILFESNLEKNRERLLQFDRKELIEAQKFGPLVQNRFLKYTPLTVISALNLDAVTDRVLTRYLPFHGAKDPNERKENETVVDAFNRTTLLNSIKNGSLTNQEHLCLLSPSILQSIDYSVIQKMGVGKFLPRSIHSTNSNEIEENRTRFSNFSNDQVLLLFMDSNNKSCISLGPVLSKDHKKHLNDNKSSVAAIFQNVI